MVASKSVFKGGAESPATPTAPSQNGKGPGKKGLKGKMMMKGKAGKNGKKGKGPPPSKGKGGGSAKGKGDGSAKGKDKIGKGAHKGKVKDVEQPEMEQVQGGKGEGKDSKQNDDKPAEDAMQEGGEGGGKDSKQNEDNAAEVAEDVPETQVDEEIDDALLEEVSKAFDPPENKKEWSEEEWAGWKNQWSQQEWDDWNKKQWGPADTEEPKNDPPPQEQEQ